MSYNNNFIATIKCKDKILREFENNIVKIPFASDYSIVLTNKHNTKAAVEITIDGKDVIDGSSIIVDPGESTELKGFIKNRVITNKFRFIEKTNEISEYRGNFIEDGLVEIKFRFEVEDLYKIPTFYHSTCLCKSAYNFDVNYNIYSSGNPPQLDQIRQVSYINDSGITAPGEQIHENVNKAFIGTLSPEINKIIFNLKGEVKTSNKNNKKIKKPITVSTKLRCSSCGRKWSSSMNYCGNCSTSLY